LNLIAASVMAGLSVLEAVFSHTIQTNMWLIVFLAWIFFAVWLLRSRLLWPWLGSLLVVSVVTLGSGSEVLHFYILILRAGYRDRSVHIDPSSVGMPLIGSLLLTVATCALLVVLSTLPVWQVKKGSDA
jgi:hypothetical protein